MSFRLKSVLIAEPVDPSCAKILESAGVCQVVTKVGLSKAELIKEIQNHDGLIVRSATKVTADIIEAGKNLKIIGRAGVGVDNIDCEAATKHGILVINAPGGNTLSAAELTCGMIVSLSRNIPGACASLKSGKWDRKSFMGSELLNKTLAIIGLGRIGREVAHRMQSFGMTTIGFDPLVPGEVSREFGVESFPLEAIWEKADYITVHTPLIPQTRNLINDEVLKKCKRGIKLVNCARGGIIDEDAALRALESGQCGGIGFDVFLEEPPKNTALIQHPKTICTPHLGASTVEAQKRVAEEIAEQFIELTNGKFIPGIVNSPAFCQSLAAETQSWVSLCQAMGTLLGSFTSSSAKDISFSLSLRGSHWANVKDNAFKVAATVGLLKQLDFEKVNFINAPILAKEANIQVISGNHSVTENVTPAIDIIIKSGDEEHSVTGELNGKIPVLTTLDCTSFGSPVPLDKHLILCRKKGSNNVFLNVIGEIDNLSTGDIDSAHFSSFNVGINYCAITGYFDSVKLMSHFVKNLDFCALLKFDS